MRKARIAEWMVSLVSSPERAVSTVGDLLESAAERGPFWFWISVARTTLSLLWRGFTAEWVRMLGFGALGLLIAFAVPFGYGLLMIATSTVFRVPGWVSITFGVLTGICAQFEVGRWLGRRFPGRELAACLALAIANSAIVFVLSLIQQPIDIRQMILSLTLWQVADIPYFAGAAWVRRRRVVPST
jgi:hypothetical protein